MRFLSLVQCRMLYGNSHRNIRTPAAKDARTMVSSFRPLWPREKNPAPRATTKQALTNGSQQWPVPAELLKGAARRRAPEPHTRVGIPATHAVSPPAYIPFKTLTPASTPPDSLPANLLIVGKTDSRFRPAPVRLGTGPYLLGPHAQNQSELGDEVRPKEYKPQEYGRDKTVQGEGLGHCDLEDSDEEADAEFDLGASLRHSACLQGARVCEMPKTRR